MPIQAYLDKAEEKTGIVDCAHERGYGPDNDASAELRLDGVAACTRQG